MKQQTPQMLNSLWVGDPMGPVERACLKSILRQGHSLTLYCYDEPKGVPAGVMLADAAEIIPKDRVFRHEWGGSFGVFSDLFRYQLQRLGKGTWVDADLYFVKPLDTTAPYIFGDQSQGLVNVAVLKLPSDSPILPPLIEVFDEKKIPFWLRPDDRTAAEERLRLTGRTGVEKMPWGITGPNALTALVLRYGLNEWVQPADVFYPKYYKQADWILASGVDIADVITPRTVAVHLWNKLIESYKRELAPPGSFLARLQREGADL